MQNKKIEELQTEILELKKRLNRNSSNSSQPPSTNGFKKIISARKPTGKKSGGQIGHKGETLLQVTNPDQIIKIPVTICKHCGHDISSQTFETEKRQVLDIPKPKTEITEYQSEIKTCPHCGKITQASFPEEINSPVQYGDRIKTQAIYLKEQQLIPEKRIQQTFEDIHQIHISTATISNFSSELSENLTQFEQHTLKQIEQSKLVHLDETGLTVSKKIHWLHTASTKKLTYYHVSPKRKSLLENLKGILVHDHWKPYFELQNEHALCNAHHLRELKSLIEDKEPWARQMHRLLIFASRLEKYDQSLLNRIEKLYDKIVKKGIEYHQNLPPYNKKKAKRPGHNLALRLLGYKIETLRFLNNPTVPFTNNQAEQDLRMMKLKQKISGCFRSQTGAEIFARIRSFISTTRKQKQNIFDCLFEAIRDNVALFYDG